MSFIPYSSSEAKFESSQIGETAKQNLAKENIAPPPDFFEGVITAPELGVAKAGANFAQFVVDATSSAAEQISNDWFHEDISKGMQEARDSISEFSQAVNPNPHTTGPIANVLYGLSKFGSEAYMAALTGGTSLMITLPAASEGYAQTREMQNRGIDFETALKEGGITAATTAAFMALPQSFGESLITKAASGAGINVTLGGLERGATGHVLRDNGYDKMAEQYSIFDGAAIATDAIFGAAFGAAHSKAVQDMIGNINDGIKSRLPVMPGNENGHGLADLFVSPTDIAMGMAFNDALKTEESAIGIPTNVETRNEHLQAMDMATKQLLNDEPVNVSGVLNKTDFIPNPLHGEAAAIIQKALDEAGYTKLIEETKTLRGQAVSRGIPVSDVEFAQPAETAPPTTPSVSTPELPAAISRDIPSENGSIESTDTLTEKSKSIDEKVAEDSKLTDAAVNCFLKG